MNQALSRIWAILSKEFIQMRRDKMTFAMMLGIPIIQLILFGYAINTDPKHLPTVIVDNDQSAYSRAISEGFARSDYFDFITAVDSAAQAEQLVLEGDAAFILRFPPDFSRNLIRDGHPQILLTADASDPSASSNAVANASHIVHQALAPFFTGPLDYLSAQPDTVDVILHRKYNPRGLTQYNIVPGLLGVILTMTSVMFTAMAMTREREKGNLENILAMPAKPLEVMLGKIIPYIAVGLVQTAVILFAATTLFTVPFVGSFLVLISAVLVFIVANLFLGFTFSTIAKTQMQAMQLTFFFFLPSILLSGFMFPFRGMPLWAQYAGETLPLTHFLRIVRGVMLKGAGFEHIAAEFAALSAFIVVMGVITVSRYHSTLD